MLIETAQASLSLHLSKWHIVGNHMAHIFWLRNKKMNFLEAVDQ